MVDKYRQVTAEIFPTDSAIKLSNAVGLCELPTRDHFDNACINPYFGKDEYKSSHADLISQCEVIRLFQQMAVSSDFDLALLASFPLKPVREALTEEQLAMLKLIHEMTKNWATGHITNKLIEHLNIGQSKDAAGIADALIAILNGQSPSEAAKGKAAGSAKKPIKQFLLGLTGDST